MADKGKQSEEWEFDSREPIIALLQELDQYLTEPLELTIVGYSSIVLSLEHNRGSDDDDVFASRTERYLRRLGFSLFDEHYFHLPPDYKQRLTPIRESFTYLQAAYISLYDTFLLKLDAGRDKDLADMRHLLEGKSMELSILDEIFEAWRQHWYSSSVSVKEEYDAITAPYR